MTALRSSIVIVTAPSGTGKTTLTRRLIDENPSLSFSVSMTTRPIRKGETNGEQYWYVDEKTFMQAVHEQSMVEWANVFGNLYGTTKEEIKRIHEKGLRAVLEIDVQGAESIRKQFPESCSVFIMPPSVASLWERLKRRGTDSLDVRWRRLRTAYKELLAGKTFQHFIINDDLEKAFLELKNLVVHAKPVSLTRSQGLAHCQKLLDEFQTDWNSETIPASLQD